MNEKFFNLPKMKQQKIINAGYRIFSQNSYKKSPMSEIADSADISKSLLFHYFKNKQELYLFLWEKCTQITIKHMTKYGCYEQTELFEMMERGMKAKIEIMKKYPYMGSFVIKAFYEKDPSVCSAIQKSYYKFLDYKANKTLVNLEPDQFIPGLDLEMMYKQMYWASDGYLREVLQNANGKMDIEKMEKDFTKMIEFWKQIYLRKEE